VAQPEIKQLTPQTPAPASISTGALSRFHLPLKPGQHSFIVGKTGSGKSVLMRFLARKWVAAGWPVLIIDPKHGYVDEDKGQHFAESPQDATIDSPYKVTYWHEGVAVQLYEPEPPALKDEALDELFFAVLKRGYVVVIIEDTYGMMSAQSAPAGYLALMANGRAKHVTVYTLSQRPMGVHDLTLSQSTHFLIFRMLGPANKKRIVEFTDDATIAYPLKRFEFRYWTEEMDKSRKFAPLRREDVIVRNVATGEATERRGPATGQARD
jgi:Helicase HerA, central domain